MMKTPDINRQTARQIMEQIGELAEAYTPEWRLDRDNPDGGTALAMIFGEMQEDTWKKYNRLPLKHMLEFFRESNTELRPAQPAGGYVMFGLVNREVGGSQVRRGTRLLADRGEGEDEAVVFETVNDVYVTPARIQTLCQILPGDDGIYRVYERDEENPVSPGGFRLFDRGEENLQRHMLGLCHDYALSMQGEGEIVLSFDLPRNGKIPPELMKSMEDPSCMRFEYSGPEGFVPFAGVKAEEDRVRLFRKSGQPPAAKMEWEGRESYWIRICCLDIRRGEALTVSGIRIAADRGVLHPEVILAGGLEQRSREYLPFGEQMGLYEEVYFSSEQMLSQKEARITLSFRMNFMKIPTENFGQDHQINWKLIMRREDFIPDPEYDIGVNEVVWEYFNGNDWRKLPESDRYAHVFCPARGTLGQKVEITFRCPQDLEPVLVQSVQSLYIRARIVKMDNLYRWNGQYIPPVLSDTAFTCEYQEPLPVPQWIITVNNMEKSRFRGAEPGQQERIIQPFQRLPEKMPAFYMGLDGPLEQGPVRFLFRMEGEAEESLPVVFEYFTGRKWKALNVIDGTEGFRKTGILTFPGNSGFVRTEAWGEEAFWIRIRREKIEGRTAEEEIQGHLIQSVEGNVTEARAVETREPEAFFIDSNEKNASYRLVDGTVYDAEVWVREGKGLTEEQLAELRRQYAVEQREAGDGTGEDIWVRWKQVESFVASGPEDRHYRLDKNEGILSFSDGIRGRIPDSGPEATIYVTYRCGGGAQGNVTAGAVNRLDSTVGYINQVTNPMDMAGGTDREDVETAVRRQGKAFRHRNRAVTAADYEALARESVGNIRKVRCFPGCGPGGEKAGGQIVLVLLMENHFRNRDYFRTVRNQCMEYLRDKVPAGMLEGGRLHIVEPVFVQLSVSALVTVQDMNWILETRQRILESLDRFLDPFTGGFQGQGWEIGTVPNQIQILNVLQSIHGVMRVESMRLTAVVWENGRSSERNLEDIRNMRFAVTGAGSHEIDIQTGGGIR